MSVTDIAFALNLSHDNFQYLWNYRALPRFMPCPHIQQRAVQFSSESDEANLSAASIEGDGRATMRAKDFGIADFYVRDSSQTTRTHLGTMQVPAHGHGKPLS